MDQKTTEAKDTVRSPSGVKIERQTSNPRQANPPYPGQPSYRRPSNLHARGGSRSLRARGGFLRGRGRGNTINSNSSRLLKDSLSKAKWRAGEEPSGIVDLPVRFGILKYDFLRVAYATVLAAASGPNGSNEVFEELHQKTGAFIKTPSYEDMEVHVWGEPAEVIIAKNLLEKLILQSRFSVQAKKTEWTKIRAHSLQQEADAAFQEQREHEFKHLREEPDLPSAFPEKLLFFWPTEHPSLWETLGPKLEALDGLRAKYDYIIYVPSELQNYICVLGHRQDEMRKILKRLRNKWSEAMANCNPRHKAYIVEPPKPSSMKEAIVVKKGLYASKAFLEGEPMAHEELENWADRAHFIRGKNNGRILSTIEKSLQGISFDRRHLRMRINFGTFVLDSYRRPQGKPVYTFEEFREMVLIEGVTGRLVPGLKVSLRDIFQRFFEASDLIEPIGTTSTSPENGDHAFSVSFEFAGESSNNLCLEAEFKRRPGAGQYEVSQRRWLRHWKGDQSIHGRLPLQIAVTDFDRSDWQLEIKSLEFHAASTVDAALKTFSHSIGFECPIEIGAMIRAPERKVTFPAWAPVSRFVEKAALRFRVKRTNYIFEIARYDEYKRLPDKVLPSLPGEFSKVPFTTWGASLFDPNWDNLLGQHANLPTGASTACSADLESFFTPQEQSATLDKSENFWQFIDLVKSVAEILGSNHITSTSGQIVLKKHPSPAKGSHIIDSDLGTLF